jgi:hypothetical protein
VSDHPHGPRFYDLPPEEQQRIRDWTGAVDALHRHLTGAVTIDSRETLRFLLSHLSKDMILRVAEQAAAAVGGAR